MVIKGEYANASLVLSQGIEVDLQNKCYVTFNRLFRFLKFKDACKPLPKAEYVLLFRTLYNKCQSCSIQDFENSSVIQLSLVHGKNRKLIVHESNDMDYTMNLAKQLAKELKLKIRDGATNRRSPQWLKA